MVNACWIDSASTHSLASQNICHASIEHLYFQITISADELEPGSRMEMEGRKSERLWVPA